MTDLCAANSLIADFPLRARFRPVGSAMWDSAPFIPAATETLKRKLNIAAERNPHLRRIVRSAPCAGVQVGGFHTVERDDSSIMLRIHVSPLCHYK